MGALACLACASALAASTTFTKTQAATLARAVNLRSADLPGYASAPNPNTASSVAAGNQLARCTGGVTSNRQLVDVNSPLFSKGSTQSELQFSSNVVVLPLSSLVQRDLNALRSSRGQSCLRSFVSSTLKQAASNGVKFGSATISRLSVPAHGTSGTFGVRVTSTATEGAARLTFYVDLLGGAVGHAEVSLDVLGLSRPAPGSTEQHLFTLLVGRADAAKH